MQIVGEPPAKTVKNILITLIAFVTYDWFTLSLFSSALRPFFFVENKLLNKKFNLELQCSLLFFSSN